MDKLVYEKLLAAVARRGGGFPIIEHPSFHEIMDLLFTEEEAVIAAAIPAKPVTAEDLAAQLNMTPGAAREKLEGMARKGTVFAGDIAGRKIYSLFPFIPGMMENQIMTGATDERAKRLALLCYEYAEFVAKISASSSASLPQVPFVRVLAVDKNVPDDTTVQPYDRILEYIDKAEYITQVVCHCRHSAELLGVKCDKPKDVCLSVGPGAKYMAEYGLGKAITHEEARQVLQRAEDAGLVHIASNTGKYLDLICNCCSCHCDNIISMKKAGDARVLVARSSFIAALDVGECIGCEDCITRCPMDALTMKDDVAALDDKRCIGCGLCISTCSSGALKLKNRENAPVPYDDSRKLNAAIVASIVKPS